MSFDKYAWIEQLLADDLPDGAKVVGVRLALKHADQTGRCHPGYRRLAVDTGRSESAVRRSTASLRDAGYVDWTPGSGSGHSNRYRLSQPQGGQTRAPSERGRQRTPSPKKVVTGETEGGHSWNERWSPANTEPSIEPTKEPSIHGGTDGSSYEEWKDQVFDKIRDSPKVPAWVITRIADDSESKKDLLRAELSKAFEVGHDPGAVARALVGRGGWEGVTVVSAVMASRLREWLDNGSPPARSSPGGGRFVPIKDDGLPAPGCQGSGCPRLATWQDREHLAELCDEHAGQSESLRKVAM